MKFRESEPKILASQFRVQYMQRVEKARSHPNCDRETAFVKSVIDPKPSALCSSALASMNRGADHFGVDSYNTYILFP